jgi:copper homeostasis protein
MGGRITLEVCVDGPDGLMAAIGAGADRVELCSSLPLNGLTPSVAMMRLAAAQEIPSYAMIHPRPGDYCYSSRDLDMMRWEIDAVREAGLAGVVIGAQTASGALDEGALRLLSDHAGGLGRTLHRIVDIVPDMDQALETAVALGFERVLTSGGCRTALEGADVIAGLVQRAAGRISLMPGCGVNPANAAQILKRTGAREIHGSFGAKVGMRPVPEAVSAKAVALGFVSPDWKDTSAETVAAVRAAVDGV